MTLDIHTPRKLDYAPTVYDYTRVALARKQYIFSNISARYDIFHDIASRLLYHMPRRYRLYIHISPSEHTLIIIELLMRSFILFWCYWAPRYRAKSLLSSYCQLYRWLSFTAWSPLPREIVCIILVEVILHRMRSRVNIHTRSAGHERHYCRLFWELDESALPFQQPGCHRWIRAQYHQLLPALVIQHFIIY